MKSKFKYKNLVILVLCVVFLCGFIKQQNAASRIKKSITEQTEKLNELNELNEKLTEEVDNSQSDEYREKLAREKLNMIKDGEKSVEQEGTTSNSKN